VRDRTTKKAPTPTAITAAIARIRPVFDPSSVVVVAAPSVVGGAVGAEATLVVAADAVGSVVSGAGAVVAVGSVGDGAVAGVVVAGAVVGTGASTTNENDPEITCPSSARIS